MPRLTEVKEELLAALIKSAGPPAPLEDDGFERIVRAFLEQVADDRTARRILTELREAGLLAAGQLAEATLVELGEVVLAARGKCSPPKWLGQLSMLAQWADELGDDWEAVSTEQLREGLLAIRGIGPSTADAILLFGFGRPVVPVDRGAYRVLLRHDWIDPSADYDEARSVAEVLVGESPALAEILTRGLGQVAGRFCRAARPRCEDCPLRPFLPEGGPREPDAMG